MATAGPRMGVELEFPGLEILWTLGDEKRTFYPPPGPRIPAVPVLEWNAARGRYDPLPILVPAEPSHSQYGTESDVNWEGLFGFHCVADGIGGMKDVYFADGPPETNVKCCIVELNSSAQDVGDYQFWIQLHLCTRKFRDAILFFRDKSSVPGKNSSITIDTLPTVLRPLNDFVTKYNSLVDEVSVPTGFVDLRNIFKIQLSNKIKSLATGKDPHFDEVHWTPKFRIAKGPDQEHCAVQVNYQVELGWLGAHVEDFCRLWQHTWVYKFGRGHPQLDWPVVHWEYPINVRTVNVNDVHRTMQSAALWRVAGNCAAKLVRLALAAAGDEGANGEEEKGQEIDLREPQRSQIVGLLTYLLAVGSLTPTLTMGRTPKNTHPQLPKTSPAALALAIVAQDTSGAARRLFWGLSRDAFVSGVVRPLVLTEVRNIGNLVTVGGLRQVTPQPANTTLEVTYDRGTGAKDILAGGEPPLWQSMWKAALSLDATNLTAAYRFGLFSGAPFHVTWSNDVQTAVPPTSGTSVPLLTFESRYGWNVMNIGWSPSTSRFMFAKSYLPLVAALAPAQLAAATPAARALGTDRLPLALNLEPELNLIAGWH